MYIFRLRILLLDDSIGFAVDKGYKKSFWLLTPYYFWPVCNAWEQLKQELKTKNWINENEKIEILNTVSEFLNQWQNRKIQAFIPPNQNLKIQIYSTCFL